MNANMQILKVKVWKHQKDHPYDDSWDGSGAYEQLSLGQFVPLIDKGVIIGYSSRAHVQLEPNFPTELSISFKPDKQ